MRDARKRINVCQNLWIVRVVVALSLLRISSREQVGSVADLRVNQNLRCELTKEAPGYNFLSDAEVRFICGGETAAVAVCLAASC